LFAIVHQGVKAALGCTDAPADVHYFFVVGVTHVAVLLFLRVGKAELLSEEAGRTSGAASMQRVLAVFLSIVALSSPQQQVAQRACIEEEEPYDNQL
jgi:hypothetical protein